MATATFGQRGITVARDLLKASGAGLDQIQGGGLMSVDVFDLVWENYGNTLKTTNSMVTGNALIFQYPKSKFELVWGLPSPSTESSCSSVGYNPIGTACSTEGGKMTVSGSDIGSSGDDCYELTCYPSHAEIRNLVLSDSSTGTKALTLVLQTGTIQSDTIKFIREIVITLDEQA